MFRTSEPPNPLDDIIKKATDETLTSDNWEYIIDVCDKVTQDPEQGTKNAIKSVEKRLLSKDANVNLRTLSLITSLAENCGSRMKQEIASKYFTNLLIDKIDDNKVHQTIKIKIAEVIGQLSRSFANDPSLKPMTDAYQLISTKYPNLHSPEKPEKNKITNQDKLNEDEEMNRVLQLSLKEYEKNENFKKNYLNQSNLFDPSSQTTPQSIKPNHQPVQPIQSNQSTGHPQNPFTQKKNSETDQSILESKNQGETQSTATITKVRALYDLVSYEEDELSFRKGDVITVLESVYRDWWRGSLRGKVGIFPLNYVSPLKDPTPEEILQESVLESTILKESRNIEKLLAILSNKQIDINSITNDNQLNSLYNNITPLRPQLGKLIEKYSMKKDDLILLNDKLGDAERLYSELMDASVQRYKNNYPPQQQNLPYPQDFNSSFNKLSMNNLPTNSNLSNNSNMPTNQSNFYPPQAQAGYRPLQPTHTNQQTGYQPLQPTHTSNQQQTGYQQPLQPTTTSNQSPNYQLSQVHHSNPSINLQKPNINPHNYSIQSNLPYPE